MQKQDKSQKHIVLTGGGTAGHITPNFAVAQELLSRGQSVSYIGLSKGMEESLVKEQNILFYGISGGKLRRNFKWQNITDLGRIALGFFQSISLLARLKPQLVFSKGGFVTTPVVWAAWCLSIPVVLHESDLTPGLANRLSLPFSRVVAYAFSETERYLPPKKAVYTGLPIRKSLLNGNREKGLAMTKLTGDKPIVFVTGGSQGARSINRCVRDNLDGLLENYEICHLVGKGNIDDGLKHTKGYCQIDFITEGMNDLYAMADYVVSRAGATTIFEMLALKKPHILIPLGSKATRGDQILNANSFEASGFSMVIEDQMDMPLLESLMQLEKKAPAYIAAMSRESNDASSAVGDLIMQTAK